MSYTLYDRIARIQRLGVLLAQDYQAGDTGHALLPVVLPGGTTEEQVVEFYVEFVEGDCVFIAYQRMARESTHGTCLLPLLAEELYELMNEA
jgi:RecA/RadA recombinase